MKIISNRNLLLFWHQNLQRLPKQVSDEDNDPKDNCDVEYLYHFIQEKELSWAGL